MWSPTQVGLFRKSTKLKHGQQTAEQRGFSSASGADDEGFHDARDGTFNRSGAASSSTTKTNKSRLNLVFVAYLEQTRDITIFCPMLSVLFMATSLRARQLTRETSDEFPVGGSWKIDVGVAMWVIVGAITAMFVVVAGGLNLQGKRRSQTPRSLHRGGTGGSTPRSWTIGIEVLRHACLWTVFGCVVAIVMAINDIVDSPFEPGTVQGLASERL